MATNLATHVAIPPEDSEIPDQASSQQSQTSTTDPGREGILSQLTISLPKAPQASSETPWYLHPGTAHYTPSRLSFSSYTPVRALATSGTGEHLLITGIGVVELNIQPHAEFNDNEGGIMELNLALHIPAAENSGLSAYRLDKAGNKVTELREAGAWKVENGDGRVVCFGRVERGGRRVALAGRGGGEMSFGRLTGVAKQGAPAEPLAVNVSRKELQLCLYAQAEALAKAKACAEWFYAGEDGPALPK